MKNKYYRVYIADTEPVDITGKKSAPGWGFWYDKPLFDESEPYVKESEIITHGDFVSKESIRLVLNSWRGLIKKEKGANYSEEIIGSVEAVLDNEKAGEEGESD